MKFTDPHTLEIIAYRYGPRLAKEMCAVGPLVLDVLKSFDGAFRLRHAVAQMIPNGFAAFSEAQRKNIALAVIRYINESNEPLYYQRKHIGGTQAWIELRVASENKQSLRDLDHDHAEKSRRIYKYVRADELPTQELGRQKPIQHQAHHDQIEVTPDHMNIMRAGVMAFMQKINCPLSHIKSADAALQMYDAAVMDKFIAESDDMTAYNADQLKSALKIIFGL